MGVSSRTFPLLNQVRNFYFSLLHGSHKYCPILFISSLANIKSYKRFFCLLFYNSNTFSVMVEPQPAVKHQAASCSLLQKRDGGEGGVEKLMGGDKDTLTGRAHANPNKEFIHHFPWAGSCSTIPRRAGLYHM